MTDREKRLEELLALSATYVQDIILKAKELQSTVPATEQLYADIKKELEAK